VRKDSAEAISYLRAHREKKKMENISIVLKTEHFTTAKPNTRPSKSVVDIDDGVPAGPSSLLLRRRSPGVVKRGVEGAHLPIDHHAQLEPID
jgi:hypothetical protein